MKKMPLILMVYPVLIFVCYMENANASEELVIVGTGSAQSLLRTLAKAFTATHPEINVIVPDSIGSGGGIRAVGNDEYLLGRIGRDLEEREKQFDLEIFPIAKTPIVFYANTNIPVYEITYEQVCRIYNGTIRKWEEICNWEGNIRVIRREDGDSSLLVLLKTVPGFNDIIMTPRSKMTYTDQETIESCKAQADSIAYGSLSDIKHEIGLRALTLEGIYPTNPQYPHMGILSLIYKQKNFKGNVKRFIEFISSSTAKEAIRKSGGLPMK